MNSVKKWNDQTALTLALAGDGCLELANNGADDDLFPRSCGVSGSLCKEVPDGDGSEGTTGERLDGTEGPSGRQTGLGTVVRAQRRTDASGGRVSSGSLDDSGNCWLSRRIQTSRMAPIAEHPCNLPDWRRLKRSQVSLRRHFWQSVQIITS